MKYDETLTTDEKTEAPDVHTLYIYPKRKTIGARATAEYTELQSKKTLIDKRNFANNPAPPFFSIYIDTNPSARYYRKDHKRFPKIDILYIYLYSCRGEEKDEDKGWRGFRDRHACDVWLTL